jgi:hypothetical protein
MIFQIPFIVHTPSRCPVTTRELNGPDAMLITHSYLVPEYVALHLHSSYIFLACYLIKHRDNAFGIWTL